jgi:hypothetical protein
VALASPVGSLAKRRCASLRGVSAALGEDPSHGVDPRQRPPLKASFFSRGTKRPPNDMLWRGGGRAIAFAFEQIGRWPGRDESYGQTARLNRRKWSTFRPALTRNQDERDQARKAQLSWLAEAARPPARTAASGADITTFAHLPHRWRCVTAGAAKTGRREQPRDGTARRLAAGPVVSALFGLDQRLTASCS